jgi:hypothetical protein
MGSGVHCNLSGGTLNARLIWRYCLLTIHGAIAAALSSRIWTKKIWLMYSAGLFCSMQL